MPALTDGFTDTTGAGFFSGLGSAGGLLSVAGLVTSTIGAYNQAQAARYQSQSSALQLELEQSLANINARLAEMDIENQEIATRRAVGRSDLRYRSILARARVNQARGGIQSGVGSAGEVAASILLARESDRISITSEGIRAANAIRMRGAGFLNQATAAGAAARNLRGLNISPALAGLSTFLGGGSGIVRDLQRTGRERRFFASQGG